MIHKILEWLKYKSPVILRSTHDDKLEELQDFALWMTGCGYDFDQHEVFRDRRHLLTEGSAERSQRYRRYDLG